MPGKERRTATKAGRLPPAEKNLAGHLKFMENGRRCQGKRVERKEGGRERKDGKVLRCSWAPLLLCSWAGRWPVGGLELLGAYCVETAQFFFDHFRKMQYPLFGAVERGGGGGLGEQPKVAEMQKVYSEEYAKCTLEYTKCRGNTQNVPKFLHKIQRLY